MFKKGKRVLSVVFILVFILTPFTGLIVPVYAADEVAPVVRVSANNSDWVRSADVSKLNNLGNDWVASSIDLNTLFAGENKFYIDTNVNNAKLQIVCSALGSVAENQRGKSWFTDNGGASWAEISSQKVVNAILRVWKNNDWVTINNEHDSGSGGTMGIGTSGGNVYGVGRSINVTAAQLEGAEKAELLVNVHVPDGASSLTIDQKTGVIAPLLVASVNDKPMHIDLSSKMGTTAAWIYAPIDISKLAKGNNTVTLDSNVTGTNVFSQQLALCLTAGNGVGESYISNNGMSSWDKHTDRFANVYLELFDGTKWVKAPAGETYTYDYDKTTVLGKYSDNSAYNFKRVINISDLSGFTKARLAVNANVGSRLDTRKLAALPEEPVKPEPEKPTTTATPTTTAPIIVEVPQDPAVRVQVNGGDWVKTGDVSKLNNLGNDWIGAPIALSNIKVGENVFYVDTNVDKGALKIVCSATASVPAGERGKSWFTDNGGASWVDISDQKVVNVILRVWKNGDWVNINKNHDEGKGDVIGIGSVDKNVFGVGRTISVTAADIKDAERAELIVNVHVPGGANSLKLDPKAGGVAPVLKSKINGKLFYTDLTNKMGSVNTWAYVDVNVSDLTTGKNTLTFDSNVKSTDYFPNQLSMLFSPKKAGDSFVSEDGMQNWTAYTDKIANVKLELYNGKEWVSIPAGEAYKYDYDLSVVMGAYKDGTKWAFKRDINIDSLSGFTKARIAVNLNVGSRLEATKLNVPSLGQNVSLKPVIIGICALIMCIVLVFVTVKFKQEKNAQN